MDKYLHIILKENRFRINGVTEASLGYPIERAGKETEGVFVRWKWNGTDLVIKNDRFGFYPLFYYCDKRQIIISESIIQVLKLGVSPEIDYAALSVFFRLGMFLGNDTPFRNIKVVPPGVDFVWNANGLSISGSYRLGQSFKITRKDAISEYNRLFANSIDKRLPKDNDFAVPLSGGRDSRRILLELHKRGLNPKYCITAWKNPPEADFDLEVAAELVKRLNMDHIIIKPDGRLQSESELYQKTHFCTDSGSWMIAFTDYMNRTVSCTYDGVAGGIWPSTSRLATQEMNEAFYGGLLDKLSNMLLTSSLSVPFSAGIDTSRLTYEVAYERLIEELQFHHRISRSFTAFIFWNRTRRKISTAPLLLNKDITVFCPYLDYDLLYFVSGLPPEVDEGNFLTESLHQAYPAFSDIPFARFTRRRDMASYFAYAIGVQKHLFRHDFQLFLKNLPLVTKWAYCLIDSRYRTKNRSMLSPLHIYYALMLDNLIDKVS